MVLKQQLTLGEGRQATLEQKNVDYEEYACFPIGDFNTGVVNLEMSLDVLLQSLVYF